jgi:ferredoxin
MQTAVRPSRAADSHGDEEIRPCGLCLRCVAVCPTGALQYHDRIWHLDLGRCQSCRECTTICPNSLISGRVP